jgi:hypothetical protein
LAVPQTRMAEHGRRGCCQAARACLQLRRGGGGRPLRTRGTYRLSAAVISAHVPPRLRRAPAYDKLSLLVAALAVSDTGRSARLGDVAPAATVAGAGRGDLTDSPSSPSRLLSASLARCPTWLASTVLLSLAHHYQAAAAARPGCGPARWRRRGRARSHSHKAKRR